MRIRQNAGQSGLRPAFIDAWIADARSDLSLSLFGVRRVHFIQPVQYSPNGDALDFPLKYLLHNRGGSLINDHVGVILVPSVPIGQIPFAEGSLFHLGAKSGRNLAGDVFE